MSTNDERPRCNEKQSPGYRCHVMRLAQIIYIFISTIILPTMDTVSDLQLLVKLYRGVLQCPDLQTNNYDRSQCQGRFQLNEFSSSKY